MATPKNVASLRPDDFVQAGLMDDFDGTITKARFLPWDYNGNLDFFIFAAAITIQPDDGDEFTQHYSAGDLEAFVPADEDGDPVDIDGWDEQDASEVEGVYAYQVGKRKSLSNNSNWAAFMFALRDAGFPEESIDADIRFAEGIHAHFNRIPQQKRRGIVKDDGEGKSNDILVVTELLEAAKKAKSGSGKKAGGTEKTKAKASNAKAAEADEAEEAEEESGDDELRSLVEEIILEALAENDGEMSKAELPSLVIKQVKDKASKAAAVKMVADVGFLSSSEAFEFDPDEGTISLP